MDSTRHSTHTDSKCLIYGKGRHDLSGVWLNNTGKDWDGSGYGLLREEAKDAKHGQSPVVDFLDESLGLVFLRSVLGDLEGIVQVERDIVRDVVKGRVLAGLSTLGVVGSVAIVAQLRVPLEETDKSDDLDLGGHGKGIPLFGRGQIDAWWGVSSKGGPREDKVGLDDVSNKGGHSDAAVPGSRKAKVVLTDNWDNDSFIRTKIASFVIFVDVCRSSY